MALIKAEKFWVKATQMLKKCNHRRSLSAIVFIDFEGFTSLDSIFGPLAVDAFLQEAATRLNNALQEDDLISFWGRNQLVCFLSSLLTPGHVNLAGYKIINVLSFPFMHGTREIILTTRVGISLNFKPKYNLDTLLRQATVALQHAAYLREPLTIYTPDLDELVMLEMDLIVDLERAIDESRIFLVYQPQLLVSTNTIIGAESLLRWNHPVRGPIWPGSMVQAAERTALISKLTQWVLNTAMRQCAELRKRGLDMRISVNFSAHNLREPDLADLVAEVLAIWGTPPHLVLIELTETAIMQEHKQSIQTLYRFREMGIQIAMDDFGTGYSSMALLGQLPIDEIKIDISFIRNMLSKPEVGRIVATLIELGHGLNMKVVAEGVETLATYECLKNLGCDLIQGHFIGYPLPLSEFIPFVKIYNSSGPINK